MVTLLEAPLGAHLQRGCLKNSRLLLKACAAWRELGHHISGHKMGREDGMSILKEDLPDSVVPVRRKRKARARSTMVKGFSSWFIRAVELLTEIVELYQLKRPNTFPW